MSREACDRALALLASGVLSIDADGRIWRHAINVRGRDVAIIPRRAENVGGKGYLRLTLQIPGVGLVQTMAHRVVWEATNGPIPDGLQINHKDLSKTNNRLDNLEVVTGSENMRHAYVGGRALPWSHARERGGLYFGRPIITMEQAKQMVDLRQGGALFREIAARFGVSTTHAHNLVMKTRRAAGKGVE